MESVTASLMKVISKLRSEWYRLSVPGDVNSMCKGPETEREGKHSMSVTVEMIV